MLASIVGGTLFVTGVTGLVSGLGGKYFFLWPVYDPGYLATYGAYWSEDTHASGAPTTYGIDAWCSGDDMPALLYPPGTFAGRLWYLFPTLSLKSCGIETSRAGGFTGAVYQGGYGNWESDESSLTFEASFTTGYNLSQLPPPSNGGSYGPPPDGVAPPPIKPGHLGAQFNTVLGVMIFTGLFIMIAEAL